MIENQVKVVANKIKNLIHLNLVSNLGTSRVFKRLETLNMVYRNEVVFIVKIVEEIVHKVGFGVLD